MYQFFQIVAVYILLGVLDPETLPLAIFWGHQRNILYLTYRDNHCYDGRKTEKSFREEAGDRESEIPGRTNCKAKMQAHT